MLIPASLTAILMGGMCLYDPKFMRSLLEADMRLFYGKTLTARVNFFYLGISLILLGLIGLLTALQM